MTERRLTLMMFVSNALLGVALVSLFFSQEAVVTWSVGLWVVSLLGLGQIDHATMLRQRRARSDHPGAEAPRR
jgi:hypothetical protein